MKKKFGLHMNIILNTMCMFAGVNYNDVDFSKDDWYSKHTWGKDNEGQFKEWLVHYIHKMPAAQKELYDCTNMTKPQCELSADWFIMNHGWKSDS